MSYFHKVSASQVDTFLSHISDPDSNGCRVWFSKIDSKNYPVYTIKVEGKTKYVAAHRFAFFLFNGMEANGLVRHSCDNPSCLTKEHLVEGTKWDNARDMVERGRSTRGSNNPAAVLNEHKVREIRKRAVNEPIGKLAMEYGVSYATIRSLRKGFTWAHVTEDPNDQAPRLRETRKELKELQKEVTRLKDILGEEQKEVI